MAYYYIYPKGQRLNISIFKGVKLNKRNHSYLTVKATWKGQGKPLQGLTPQMQATATSGPTKMNSEPILRDYPEMPTGPTPTGPTVEPMNIPHVKILNIQALAYYAGIYNAGILKYGASALPSTQGFVWNCLGNDVIEGGVKCHNQG